MTLRECIKQGLKEQHTDELENSLFWSIHEFIVRVREKAKGKHLLILKNDLKSLLVKIEELEDKENK